MANVTIAEVKAVVTTTLTDDQIQLWIDVASEMVIQYSACINGSDTLKAKIELYLSAHFVEVDGVGESSQISKEKLGPLETSYAAMASEQGSIVSTKFGSVADRLAGGCFSRYKEDTATAGFF